MNTDSAFDNLVRMVQVIGRDRELRCWFAALTTKSTAERCIDIYTTSERMRAEGKDADLVRCFRLLADPRVFEAASLALQDDG